MECGWSALVNNVRLFAIWKQSGLAYPHRQLTIPCIVADQSQSAPSIEGFLEILQLRN